MGTTWPEPPGSAYMPKSPSGHKVHSIRRSSDLITL
jgi:hypothetical protein